VNDRIALGAPPRCAESVAAANGRAERENAPVRVSAKADYALRAAAELAAAEGEGPVKGEQLARAQGIPPKFLENILLELRHAGLVQSQRGVEGGYWLARPAAEITLAEVIRAVEGPLANVRGTRPESVEYEGAAESLRQVWIAVRASLRSPPRSTASSPTPRPGVPTRRQTARAERRRRSGRARARARPPRRA